MALAWWEQTKKVSAAALGHIREFSGFDHAWGYFFPKISQKFLTANDFLLVRGEMFDKEILLGKGKIRGRDPLKKPQVSGRRTGGCSGF